MLIITNFPLDASSIIAPSSSSINISHKNESTELVQKISLLEHTKTKCTAGTSTEELTSYCSSEVQTGPSDGLESNPDVVYGPVENVTVSSWNEYR